MITDADGSVTLAVAADTPEAVLQLPRPMALDGIAIRISGVEERTTIDRRFGEPVALPAAISEIRFDGTSPGVQPSPLLEADCRSGLLSIDGEAVGVSYSAPTASVLVGDALEATICSPPATLGVGEHEVVSDSAAGIQLDRVTITEPLPVASAQRTDVIAPTILSSTRTERVVEVPPCPDGCWVVLGEGFNPAWTASVDGQVLGDTQLVDANANGWYLDGSTRTRTVTITWTAQRPLTVALILSLLSVIGLIAVVVFDRRRAGEAAVPDAAPAESPSLDAAGRRWERVPAAVTVVIASAASALLIGWVWAPLALFATVPALVLRRGRVLGWIGVALVVGAGAVVTWVVRVERPFPNAGWPVRFEWLHGWTLLGIVLITCSTLFASDARRQRR